MVTIVTKAEFAKMRGVAPSSVTRWAREGRLVLTDDGRVAVEPSVERLQATEINIGRAEKWRERRKAVKKDVEGSDEGASELQISGGDNGASLMASRAMKERYMALKAKLEYEQLAGELVPREDFDYMIRTAGAVVRTKIDSLADRYAALLAPVTDLSEAHEILASAARTIESEIAEELARLSNKER